MLSGCELEIAARGAMGDDGEEGIGVERRRSGHGLPYIPWWRWTGQSRNLLQRVAYSPLHQAKYPVCFVCNLPCYRRFADSLGDSRTSPAKTRRSSLSVPTWCTDLPRLRVTKPGTETATLCARSAMAERDSPTKQTQTLHVAAQASPPSDTLPNISRWCAPRCFSIQICPLLTR